MSERRSPDTEVARRFADALDSGDSAAAAMLLAEDAELAFPGATLRGRATWLEARAGQAPTEHLTESVEDATFVESDRRVEMKARLVQRWVESGEIAHEQPVLVVFEVADGLICRLEFLPGEQTAT